MDQNDACGTPWGYESDFVGNCELSRTVESWQCRVSEYSVCNGFSSCLIDECRCEQDAFNCADGVGCIAMENLCNGFKDCNDGSDECMCENTVICYIDEVKFCVPEELYCKGRLLTYSKCKSRAGEANCAGIKADDHFVGQNSPMLELVNNYFLKMWDQTENLTWEEKDAYIYNNKIFLQFCVTNCDSGYEHFCAPIDIKMPGATYFDCGDQRFYVKMICDGNLDCDNGADERGCPGRYYCTDIQVTLFLAVWKNPNLLTGIPLGISVANKIPVAVGIPVTNRILVATRTTFETLLRTCVSSRPLIGFDWAQVENTL